MLLLRCNNNIAEKVVNKEDVEFEITPIQKQTRPQDMPENN